MGSFDHMNDPAEKTILKNDKFWVSQVAGRGAVHELCGYTTKQGRAGYYHSRNLTVHRVSGFWVLQEFTVVDNNNDWTYNNYSYEICGTAIDRDLDLATLLGRNETLVLDTIR